MVIVLVALTVLLSAIAFQWQGTIIAAAIGLTVVIVHILSEIHQRLLQLEQAAPSYFAQSAGIGMQRIVIYSAALVALLPYANTWMWLAGGALLVLMLCLIQTISAFQTRLLHLEQYTNADSKAEVLGNIQNIEIDHTTPTTTPVFEPSIQRGCRPMSQQLQIWIFRIHIPNNPPIAKNRLGGNLHSTG